MQVASLEATVIESFSSAVPELLRTGGLVKAALQIPLLADRTSIARSERIVKDLLLLLARRLRGSSLMLAKREGQGHAVE